MTVTDAASKSASKRPVKTSSAGKGKPGKFNKDAANGKGNKRVKGPRNAGDAKTADGEKKAKKKQPKKKKNKTPKVDKTRDFAGDLETYLEEWESREQTGTWKFNKILQAWTLENCFSKKKMPSPLFKQAIPYLLTVQGGAMDRLVSRAAAIMSTDKSEIVNDDADVAEPATAEGDENDNNGGEDDDGDDDEEGGGKKKKEVITKSMVSRAKKLQKALNA